MPRTIEINNGMNNSNAFVTPQRSEIRISFGIEYPTVSETTKRILRKVSFVATFLIVFTLSFCYMLDVQMTRSYAAVLVILASVGILYCTHTLWRKLGGMDGILNHEEKEV